MFKILALVGAIAGGATYGLYAHTDLFNKHCDGACPLSALSNTASAEPKPCCLSGSAAKPSCCEKSTPCCEETSDCCATKALAAKGIAPLFASQTIPVSAAKATCCADPCPDCATACAVCCPVCPDVCGACCGTSAKAAIGGSAAIVAGALKK